MRWKWLMTALVLTGWACGSGNGGTLDGGTADAQADTNSGYDAQGYGDNYVPDTGSTTPTDGATFDFDGFGSNVRDERDFQRAERG